MNDFDKRVFNIDLSTGAEPAAGAILVAEPFLREEHFHHSVIILADYAPGTASLGVVMNRKTSYCLHQVLDGASQSHKVPLYCGGPVALDRLLFIHTLPDLIEGGRDLDHNLFLGGDIEAALDYVNAGYPVDGQIRFFLGYSSWSPGQLEEEIANRVWAVSEIDNSHRIITDSEDRYWHRYVKLLGDNYRGWRYHPRNPHFN